MGGGGFPSDPMLPVDSATYCAAVVGEYLYGVCYHRGTGEDAKMQGAPTAFRAKRTLCWFANTLVGVHMVGICIAAG